MNNWKAQVSESLGEFTQEVRLAQLFDTRIVAAVRVEGGDVVMEEFDRGAYVPTLLRLPREALIALRDALNKHAPPTDDRDLRDALRVERERVDRVLGTIVDPA